MLCYQVTLLSHRREWALQRGELITIFFMMTVASAIPTKGVNGLLLPMITGTFYYATPENDWANQIHPHLPNWILVDDVQAVDAWWTADSGCLISPSTGWEVHAFDDTVLAILPEPEPPAEPA